MQTCCCCGLGAPLLQPPRRYRGREGVQGAPKLHLCARHLHSEEPTYHFTAVNGPSSGERGGDEGWWETNPAPSALHAVMHHVPPQDLGLATLTNIYDISYNIRMARRRPSCRHCPLCPLSGTARRRGRVSSTGGSTAVYYWTSAC